MPDVSLLRNGRRWQRSSPPVAKKRSHESELFPKVPTAPPLAQFDEFLQPPQKKRSKGEEEVSIARKYDSETNLVLSVKVT